MTTKLYVCMTSGIEGPEAELTEEQSQKIIELVGQLSQPWVGDAPIGMNLSKDHFIVDWDDDNSLISAIRTDPSGYVNMWKRGDTDWHDFVDTVGLWSYLSPLGVDAHQKWVKQSSEAMEKFYEEMQRIP